MYADGVKEKEFSESVVWGNHVLGVIGLASLYSEYVRLGLIGWKMLKKPTPGEEPDSGDLEIDAITTLAEAGRSV